MIWRAGDSGLLHWHTYLIKNTYYVQTANSSSFNDLKYIITIPVNNESLFFKRDPAVGYYAKHFTSNYQGLTIIL